MARRLYEIYRPGDHVQILLGGRWRPAEVIGAAHPGLWVQSDDQRWYVTNRRHIRPAGTPSPPRTSTNSR